MDAHKYNHDVVDKVFRGDELRTPSLPLLTSKRVAAANPVPKPSGVKEGGIFTPLWRFLFSLGGKPFWEKNLTTLFYGPRSQGKSLHQAKTVRDILSYLEGMYNLYPNLPQAIIVSNQKFNPKIEEKYLGSRLYYWESIQQLKYCPRKDCWKEEREYIPIGTQWHARHKDKPIGTREGDLGVPMVHVKREKHRLHDCYMIIDDAATIIPADGWQDLPRWFRKVFAQAGHNGVHVIANIQDPLSCDINFRRYVDLCFKFNKVMGNRRPEAGKPPVRFIWGLYTSREIPAEELWSHGDKSEAEIQQERIDREAMESAAREAGQKIVRTATRAWKRRFHWIYRRDTEIYDTLQNVPEYMPNSFEHYEIKCIDKNCNHTSVRHRVI
jgi:hypothetical protein